MTFSPHPVQGGCWGWCVTVSVRGVQHTSVSGFSNRTGHSITSWRMCFSESWVIRLPSPPSSWTIAESLEGIPSKLLSQALSLAECGWHPSLEAGLRTSTSFHPEVTVREQCPLELKWHRAHRGTLTAHASPWGQAEESFAVTGHIEVLTVLRWHPSRERADGQMDARTPLCWQEV